MGIGAPRYVWLGDHGSHNGRGTMCRLKSLLAEMQQADLSVKSCGRRCSRIPEMHPALLVGVNGEKSVMWMYQRGQNMCVNVCKYKIIVFACKITDLLTEKPNRSSDFQNWCGFMVDSKGFGHIAMKF